MDKTLNITEARRDLLSLPEKLHPGESINVMRHSRPVLRIMRPQETFVNYPMNFIDSIREQLLLINPANKKYLKKDIAKNYKKYFYAQKKKTK